MENGLVMPIGEMMMCTEMASFACGYDASQGWQRLVSSVHRHSLQRGLIGNANDIRATAHSLRRMPVWLRRITPPATRLQHGTRCWTAAALGGCIGRQANR